MTKCPSHPQHGISPRRAPSGPPCSQSNLGMPAGHSAENRARDRSPEGRSAEHHSARESLGGSANIEQPACGQASPASSFQPSTQMGESASSDTSVGGAPTCPLQRKARANPCAATRELTQQAMANAKAQFEVSLMYAKLEGQIESCHHALPWKMRQRPTWVRRLVASLSLIVFLAVGATVHTNTPSASLSDPTRLTGLLALCLLLYLSVSLATRPMHLPSLSRWKVVGVGMLATVAAFFFAWLAKSSSACGLSPALGIGNPAPCILSGFLLGAPIFVLLRVLDRGSRLSAWLAALAAGMAANMYLHLACALNTREHELAAHFPVLIGFVLLALVRETWHAWHGRSRTS